MKEISRIVEEFRRLFETQEPSIPLKQSRPSPRALRYGNGRSRSIPQKREHISVDIITLDVSSSMNKKDLKPSRLLGAKEAAKGFIQQLVYTQPSSAVGIVEFGTRSKLVASPKVVGQAAGELEKRIDGLSIAGCTNISAGLLTAEKAIYSYRPYSDPRILLLSDGGFTDGGCPIKTANNIKQKGIRIDVIGIGGSPTAFGFHEPTLKSIASVVNGELCYWFIKSTPKLVEKFESLALREV